MPGTVYFLSLGSNLGDRRNYLREAVERLPAVATVPGEPPGIEITGIASLYETTPVGYTDQPLFLNTAVQVNSVFDPPAMLAACKRVEQELGRNTPFRWGPREIDLDLVWWGDRRPWRERRWVAPDLMIPHPRATGRLFVLVPLAELAPGLPVAGRAVEDWIKLLRNAQTGETGGQGVRVVFSGPGWVN